MSSVFRPIVLTLTVAGLGAPLAWRAKYGLAADEPTVYSDVAIADNAAAYVNGNGLRRAYRIGLVSAWPVPAGESDACNNRSTASLNGMLTQVDQSHYAGQLERRTDLGFCGRHPGSGAVSNACSMRLTGTDTVEAVAEVAEPDGNGRAARLVWRPTADTVNGGAVNGDAVNGKATGTCSTTFARALERMHATVAHGIELTLPAATVGHSEQSLDDWGWKVVID